MASTNYLEYGIIADNTITSNGDITTIYGDIGAGTSIIDTAPIVFSGQKNIGSSISVVLTSTQNAYNNFMGMTATVTISDSNIGGMTFTPGVHQ